MTEFRSWRPRRSHSGSWEYPEGKSGFGERSGKMGCRRAGGCAGRSDPRAVTRGAKGSGWRSTAERRPESSYCGKGWGDVEVAPSHGGRAGPSTTYSTFSSIRNSHRKVVKHDDAS